VEVLSPTDRASDVLSKVAMYQEAGVPLIWLVDPEAQTVTVLAANQAPVTLHPGDTLGGGNVLPDLQVAVADIFGQAPLAGDPAPLPRKQREREPILVRMPASSGITEDPGRVPLAAQFTKALKGLGSPGCFEGTQISTRPPIDETLRSDVGANAAQELLIRSRHDDVKERRIRRPNHVEREGG
jgi:hypothetical protein